MGVVFQQPARSVTPTPSILFAASWTPSRIADLVLRIALAISEASTNRHTVSAKNVVLRGVRWFENGFMACNRYEANCSVRFAVSVRLYAGERGDLSGKFIVSAA